ncbi:zinc ribbon domain-containing protein [Enterovibrio coralii]|uniref:zinc ribbon domain-containing protein n=1 Tax=Enterovibrio coralii TaxID=294935 RepID=UPI0009FAC178|nr:zinc ribbon domain-containing protein [Enterovibrio coralii]
MECENGKHLPDCQGELAWNSGSYVCNACNKTFIKQGFCKVCDAQLERLQACGSTSYFCHTCNELKSRSGARIVFAEQKAVS